MFQTLDEHALLGEVVERLAGCYPTLPPETITGVVRDVHARFNGAPIREFVPLLVEREARGALSEVSA